MKATAPTSKTTKKKMPGDGDESPRLIPPQQRRRGGSMGSGSGTAVRSPHASPQLRGRTAGSMFRTASGTRIINSNSSSPGATSSPPQFPPLSRTSSMPTQMRRHSVGDGSESPSIRPLFRINSNPFLQKPLALAQSSESLPLLGQSGSTSNLSKGSMASMARERDGSSESSRAPTPLSGAQGDDSENNPHLHPPVEGHVDRHLSLLDLIAVGVGGTLGTGIFVLCSLLSSSFAGPASVICWTLSAIPALLSGFCFAELAGQIPAAGSTYAYVYASMGELPAVVAACCLSLEYLVSASAVARGWGDKVVDWIVSSSSPGWLARALRPGLNFNPMAFLISITMAGLLLGGVKESKVITNYFTAFKVAFVAFMTSMAFGLMDPKNLTPFVPPEFGANGVLQGATASFFGFLGYDEVCCLTAEAIDPQKNMPRAILWTIAILTVSYMTATLALTGMQPYDEISAVEGFPGAFRSRDADFAANMAALGAIVTLPLVVLVAVMAQPRLQYALASDGLIPAWFGQVDETGNLWNGTLFAGVVMTLIASFVPFEHLNDMISAGVLVAFSMTNSSLILLRHESPDETPFLLETLLASFNGLAFLASLLMSTPFFASIIGKTLAFTCCLLTLLACVLIKLKCPAAAYFGGKTRRTTTQHMTVGVVSVEEEEFRTPFLPFFPCLGIFMNWYLVAQQSWSGLGLLILFLVCAILFYFSYGYYYSVGNNGGWDAYQWCDDDGFIVVMDPVAEHESESSDGNNSSTVGLPIDKEITLSLMPPSRPVATGRFEP